MLSLSPTSNRPDGMPVVAGGVHDWPGEQAAQIGAAVEAVREGGEISAGMLGPVRRMMDATQIGLEIAQGGVHPAELRQLAKLGVFHSINEQAVSVAWWRKPWRWSSRRAPRPTT